MIVFNSFFSYIVSFNKTTNLIFIFYNDIIFLFLQIELNFMLYLKTYWYFGIYNQEFIWMWFFLFESIQLDFTNKVLNLYDLP